MRRFCFVLILLLVGCGGAPQARTAQSVVDALKAGGIELSDVKPVVRDPESPVPNSYTERVEFTIPEVAPRGGQIFTCSTKQNCDALYAYFDALKALAGPYLYQSGDGMVVVQLNSGLSEETGAKAKAAIDTLP